MDCLQVRELIELVRPDSRDLEEPEFALAAAHLLECAQCSEIFADRQRFDRQVGALLRDVPVPDGLEQRLIDSLSAAEIDAAVHAAPGDPAGRMPADAAAIERDAAGQSGGGRSERVSGRRRWTWAAAILAAVFVGGIGTGLVVALSGPVLLLDEVRVKVADDFAALPEFRGNPADAALPDFGWQNAALELDGPRQLLVVSATDPAARHGVACYQFRLLARRRQPIFGSLLIVRGELISDLPAAKNMASASVVYVGGPAGAQASLAWTSQGRVYICAVQGGADALEILQRTLAVHPA